MRTLKTELTNNFRGVKVVRNFQKMALNDSLWENFTKKTVSVGPSESELRRCAARSRESVRAHRGNVSETKAGDQTSMQSHPQINPQMSPKPSSNDRKMIQTSIEHLFKHRVKLNQKA